MTNKLFLGAITKYLLGVAMVGLLIFLPAGTFSYFNGWLLMGILFVPMFFAGIVMMFKNPDLLRSRLNAKEEAREQIVVVNQKYDAICGRCGCEVARRPISKEEAMEMYDLVEKE